MSVKISAAERAEGSGKTHQAWCTECPWTSALHVVKVAAEEEARHHRAHHRAQKR